MISKNYISRKEAESYLKILFGFGKFYDNQWKTIEELYNGNRVLLIEKTGFGKSLCYQFPASRFQGVTVVFSPLIALMRDQITKLNEIGIPARTINSEQNIEENKEIIELAKIGKLKLLYVAPERQQNLEWIESVRDMNISMVVVDEAHCISMWGHDFRPSYRRIVNLLKLLPKNVPVLATTATATKKVEEDIVSQIGSGIKVIRGNLMRDNFRLLVINCVSDDEKLLWLAENLNKLPGTGIIYTATRANTEIYSSWLKECGISAVGYSAKLDGSERIQIEKGLIENRWKCIVSTNALGMGIDKPDIRFIIHTHFPESPIHYYQEIGRAGRDGEPTFIILLYNHDDISICEHFIESGKPAIPKYHRVIGEIRSKLLNESELLLATNLTRTQLEVILSDLIDFGIIRVVMINIKKKFEYIHNAPELDENYFTMFRESKIRDLNKMIEYAETKQPRMKFLCEYLGDSSNHLYTNCDNTNIKKRSFVNSPELSKKLEGYYDSYFPEISVYLSVKNTIKGVAASFYGYSDVGKIIHKSKYDTGEPYPDKLLELTENAFHKKLVGNKFDFLVYVPPTTSGDLVKDFAVKLTKRLNIPISHDLVKVFETKPQKIFENRLSKSNNVKDAFKYIRFEDIRNKNILIFDDIFDSGATLKEISQLLLNLGAKNIAILVIAKTVSGDKI